ncbi:MAG: hypothetical protein IKD20_00375 [Clostridia bacterium]|nr:hypothetical protein [Clostridia bacterium]
MISPVFVKTYDAPSYDEREILRYIGETSPNSETVELVRSCIAEVEAHLSYKVCYAVYDAQVTPDGVDMTFAKTKSTLLAKTLADSDRVILVVASVGIGIDRLVKKYLSISASRALVMQAIGAERVESLLDAFCIEMREKYRGLGQDITTRYSPGYGDLPLQLQREIFDTLECPKRIGVSLSDSMMMTPTKSVSAIIGISRSICSDVSLDKYKNCNKDCQYRR